MSEPDIYSNAWYRMQFKGVMHAVNRCNGEYASAADLIEALTSRINDLEQQLLDMQAAIGQLRDETEERMDKAREAFRKLKNGAEHV